MVCHDVHTIHTVAPVADRSQRWRDCSGHERSGEFLRYMKRLETEPLWIALLEEAVAFLKVRGNFAHGFNATDPLLFGLRLRTVESHVVHSWVQVPPLYRAQLQSSSAAHFARHASSLAALHMFNISSLV